MKPKNNSKALNKPTTELGCGSCGSMCVLTKQMETFPPQVKKQLTQLVHSLSSFEGRCNRKSNGGKFSVDSEVIQLLEALKEEVSCLQGEAHKYPEMPDTLVHLLEKHGNPLVKQVFLN